MSAASTCGSRSGRDRLPARRTGGGVTAAAVAVQRDRRPHRDVDAVPGSARPPDDRLRRPRRRRVAGPADPADDGRRRPAWRCGILDHLEVPTVDVLGVSWGGALAQEVAYRGGDRVRRLVLCATMAGGAARPRRPPGAGHPGHAAALLVAVVPQPGGAPPLRPRRGRQPGDDGPPAPGPVHPGAVGPGLRVADAGPAPLRQRPVAPPSPPADAGAGRRVRPDRPGRQRPHPGQPHPRTPASRSSKAATSSSSPTRPRWPPVVNDFLDEERLAAGEPDGQTSRR